MTAPVVAITGAGTLGRAVALALALRGVRVAIYHAGLNAPHAAAIVDALGTDRAHAHPVGLDTCDDMPAAVAATAAAFGTAPRGAVLIHDHLDGGGGGPLHAASRAPGAYRRTTAANLERVYRMLRALLPAMIAARDGSIVMIGSRLAAAPVESEGAALYGAVKAAAHALVRAATAETAALGVRASSILIGALDDPYTRATLPNVDPARWTSPDAVAAVAAFLISDEARPITGATFPMSREVPCRPSN